MIDFSTFLNEKELKLIRKEAIKNENQLQFSDEVLELIFNRAWLRVAIPNYKNGKPLDAYSIALLFEALAYADGSLGWAINLGAGANMFLGYLPAKTTTELSANKKLWFAGSGACTGKAVKTKGGYILSGHWKYASGSLYASHFTANAYLYDANEKPILDTENQPVFRSFLFPSNQVTIIDTWHTLGLKASCSNDFKVTDCFVPEEQVFDLTKESSFSEFALYRYPFDAFATSNITVMTTGIAQHFIEIFKQDIFNKKPLYSDNRVGEVKHLQKLFEKLTTDFYNKRAVFLEDLKKLWDTIESKPKDQTILESKLQDSAREAADASYVLVTGLYRFCGMNAIYTNNELNKVVRDFLVATQHYAISPLQGLSTK